MCIRFILIKSDHILNTVYVAFLRYSTFDYERTTVSGRNYLFNVWSNKKSCARATFTHTLGIHTNIDARLRRDILIYGHWTQFDKWYLNMDGYETVETTASIGNAIFFWIDIRHVSFASIHFMQTHANDIMDRQVCGLNVVHSGSIFLFRLNSVVAVIVAVAVVHFFCFFIYLFLSFFCCWSLIQMSRIEWNFRQHVCARCKLSVKNFVSTLFYWCTIPVVTMFFCDVHHSLLSIWIDSTRMNDLHFVRIYWCCFHFH